MNDNPRNQKASKQSNTAAVPSWIAWARLVRLPNVFTVLADTSAAFLLVLGGSGWTRQVGTDFTRVGIAMAITLLCVTCLYWAGMILNDVFDVRQDVRANRARPLPRRDIAVKTAKWAGWFLLVAGVLVSTFLFVVAQGDLWSRLMPTVLAVLLAVCIVAYDGPFKRTALAPVLMGGCRLLSFLLSATAATVVVLSELGDSPVTSLGSVLASCFTPVALAFACGMGLYVTGITTFARREAIGDRTIHLPVGLVGMVLGGVLIAFAPRAAELVAHWQGLNLVVGPAAWRVDAKVVFPAAIALMLAATIRRGWVACQSSSPKRIQATIRSALLAIIPLAAAITMLSVGAIPALIVFALWLPSQFLARRIQMT